MARPSVGVMKTIEEFVRPESIIVPEKGAIAGLLSHGVRSSELRPCSLGACLLWPIIVALQTKLPLWLDWSSEPKIDLNVLDVFGRIARTEVTLGGIRARFGWARFEVRLKRGFDGLGIWQVDLPWTTTTRPGPVSPLAAGFDVISSWGESATAEEVAMSPEEAARESAIAQQISQPFRIGGLTN